VFLLNQVYKVQELTELRHLDSLEIAYKDSIITNQSGQIQIHEQKDIAQHAIKEALVSKVKQGKKVIRKQRLIIVGLVVLSVIFGVK
jgi:hypothetical protein